MADLEIRPSPQSLQRVFAVLAAAAVLAFVEMYLLVGGTGDVFAPRTTLTTYMPDAAGLESGAAVRLNGFRIGSVEQVDLGSADVRRPVRARLRVLNRFLKSIPADSRTAVTSDTLVSPKFIDIKPGAGIIPVRPDGMLRSEPVVQAIDRANQLRTLQNDLTQVDQILTELSSPNSPSGQLFMSEQVYDAVLARVSGFDHGLHTFVAPQSELGKAFYTEELNKAIEDFLRQTDNLLASAQSGQGTVGHLFASDEQYNEILREATDLHKVLADANAGKGKAGALLTDETTYRQATRLLDSIDRMVTSLNAGEGRFGELLGSAQAYEALNGSLRRMSQTLEDLRVNPRAYLRVKPFGNKPKRRKPYLESARRPGRQASATVR